MHAELVDSNTLFWVDSLGLSAFAVIGAQVGFLLRIRLVGNVSFMYARCPRSTDSHGFSIAVSVHLGLG